MLFADLSIVRIPDSIRIGVRWRFHRIVITAADAGAQAETFVVTNTNDFGPGSLRTAIIDANDSEADTKTITFSVDENQTINLLSALPDIEDGVTINGSTAVNLTVDGGGALRIFRVEADTTVVKDLGLEGAPLESANGARISFNLSEDQQFDEVITDDGGLIKDGEATLTLRGANDYAGGTEVRKGTLIGDTTSLQGSITNSALVVFDQDVDDEYAGASGSGVVQNAGSGVVTFAGANTYSGGTTVSDGVLRGILATPPRRPPASRLASPEMVFSPVSVSVPSSDLVNFPAPVRFPA